MSNAATVTLPNELEIFCQQDPAQAAKRITELEKSLEWHRTYEGKMHEILANKGMSYSDRVFLAIMLKDYPNQMMSLKPFQPNISHLRQESGVGIDTATKFFACMEDARGIRYSNKPQEDKANDSYTSVSTVVPLADYSVANTRAAATRIKQKEEVKKRRARKLDIVPCENCGSADTSQAYAAIIPFCKKCEHIHADKQERVPASTVRIIEEEIQAPSHEFSESPTEEWIDDSESVIQTSDPKGSPPSHEFSGSSLEEWPTDDHTEIQTDEQEEAAPPSHEFSEAPDSVSIGASDTHLATQTNGTAPSHEFSEVQADTTNGEGSTTSPEVTTTNPSHEFSEAPDSIPGDTHSAIQTGDRDGTTQKAHEFSEGMKVETPIGIGTVSIIAEDRKRCRVRLNKQQPDGTYYAAFSMNEIQPIVQAPLL